MNQQRFSSAFCTVFLTTTATAVTGLPAQPARPTTGPKSPIDRPEWRQTVLKTARTFLTSKTFKLQHKHDHDRFRVVAATPAQHPLLRDLLPKHRFYVVQVRSVHDEKFKGKIYQAPYMTFYMARINTVTGKASFTDRGKAIGNEAWRFDAIRFLQDNSIHATSKVAAERAFLLCRTLRRLARGGGTPMSPTLKQVDQKTINKRFALGLPAPAKPSIKQQQIHVAESKTKIYAAVASQRCDDWNLPVTAEFRWLEFDKKNGRLLTERFGKGKTWPNRKFNEKVFGEEVERFTRQLAKRV